MDSNLKRISRVRFPDQLQTTNLEEQYLQTILQLKEENEDYRREAQHDKDIIIDLNRRIQHLTTQIKDLKCSNAALQVRHWQAERRSSDNLGQNSFQLHERMASKASQSIYNPVQTPKGRRLIYKSINKSIQDSVEKTVQSENPTTTSSSVNLHKQPHTASGKIIHNTRSNRHNYGERQTAQDYHQKLIRELRRQLDELKHQHKQDIADLHIIISSLKRELEDTKTQGEEIVLTFNDTINSIKNDIRMYRAQIEKKDDQIQTLRDAVAVYKTRNEEYRNQAKTTAKQYSEEIDEINRKMQDQINKLKEQLEEQRKNFQSYAKIKEEELRRYRDIKEEYQNQLTKIERSCSELLLRR